MRYLLLNGEIGPTEYENILKWALENCAEFSLTWRSEWKTEKSAEGLRIQLSPYFLRKMETDEWPGTKITDGTETVAFYEFTADSIKIIKPIHLFKFEMPFYPEDLAFYKQDGSCWFGSVAHDKMAFFIDEYLSESEIMKWLPKIDIEVFEQKEA